MPQSNVQGDDHDLLLAIQVAGGVHRSLTEIEFAGACGCDRAEALSRLSNPALRDSLRSTPVTSVNCGSCEQPVKVALNGESFCRRCARWLDKASIPTVRFSFQTEQVLRHVTERLVAQMNSLDLTVTHREESYTRLARSDGSTVDILVRSGPIRLEEYYELRGWRPSQYGLKLLVGNEVGPALAAYSAREPDCFATDFAGLVSSGPEEPATSETQKRLGTLLSATRAAREAGLVILEDQFAAESQAGLARIIQSLPKWSMQSGREPAREQETAFEKGVLTLLNLTIFRAKHLGGRNQADGYIQVSDPREPLVWVPVETKTAKMDESDWYSVDGCRVQLVKYAQAFTSSAVSQFVKVPAFLVVAKDFRLDDPGEVSLVESLESDLQMKFQFMPVDSLRYLLERWAQANLIHADPAVVKRFFTEVRYVTRSHIDALIGDLRKSAGTDASLLQEIRRQVQTRRGK